MRKNTSPRPARLASLLAVLIGPFLASALAQASPPGDGPRSFYIGGHVPNWLARYEPGANAPLSPQQAKELPAFQKAVQARADELFDVVIPGYITWGSSEPQPGKLDFRLYDAAAAWAVQQGKKTIVQHLFWEIPTPFRLG